MNGSREVPVTKILSSHRTKFMKNADTNESLNFNLGVIHKVRTRKMTNFRPYPPPCTQKYMANFLKMYEAHALF